MGASDTESSANHLANKRPMGSVADSIQGVNEIQDILKSYKSKYIIVYASSPYLQSS
jgi:hypothetical protein